MEKRKITTTTAYGYVGVILSIVTTFIVVLAPYQAIEQIRTLSTVSLALITTTVIIDMLEKLDRIEIRKRED